MSDTDFYNRNLYRNYPFVDYAPYVLDADMPREVIIDLGIVFLPGAGFDPTNEEHKIYGRVSSSVALGLIIDAPGAAVDGEEFGAADIASYKYKVHSFTIVVEGKTLAYGFVVAGDWSGRPLFPSTVSASSTTPFVERRCIQVLDDHYVNSVSIANDQRTIARSRVVESSSSNAIILSSSSPTPTTAAGDYLFAPAGRNIVGDIAFFEGFNTEIDVVTTANAIRFSAKRGAGAGEACEEIPRTYAEQIRIDNGMTLDRAVRCDEVFSNINGISPDPSGNFTLAARRGVEVTSPSAHRIRIAGRDDLEDCTP